ncbi:MAG: tripartite tricarboxylate transporter substrate binding protein [Betaproteobacteria bacterium]|nr:tripartite tricarboxylate transporter substrate binding protein [Betaproteobacteria bacterium]
MRFAILLPTLAVLAAAAAPAVHAQAPAWPAKTVKIVVAFTAGGTTDIMARTVAQRLSERYKQSFVIENKPGAGGNIGTELVAKSAPDGYTFIMNSVGPIAVNPSLFKKLPHDPINDLVPVVQVSDVPNVLLVHPSLGVKSVEGLVAYGKANPGKLNYASTGVGTSSHLSSFMLASRGGFEATHVPYKGAEALKDLLTGRVQFMFATIPSVIGHIKAGSLVAIGVSSVKRSRSMPEVPTIAESGFPGFEAGSWFGLFAPKGTSPAIIAELNKSVNEVIADRAIETKMVEEGADPVGGSPEKFAAFVRAEHEKWRAVVKASGASVD